MASEENGNVSHILSGRLDRRQMLRLSGVLLAGGAATGLLAACGGPAAPPSAASTAGAASAKPASAAASTAAKPATGSGSAAASPAASAKPSGQAGGAKVRAAFVYLGTANDHGWTQAHDDGRKKLEAALWD